MRDVLILFLHLIVTFVRVLRKKSVRDEFVNKNLRETLDCSH